MASNYMAEYEKWLNSDVLTAEEHAELLAIQDDPKEIESRFYGPLEFGTAGLRGTMKVGLHHMNTYVVRHATQGFANVIAAEGEEAKERGVAICMDCRIHSMDFARTAAEVMVGNGIRGRIFDALRPTPELSFAVREYHCQAGINITASHNPKEYNGYKVYWEDGAQLPPQHADAIAEQLTKIDIFKDIRSVPYDEAVVSGMITVMGDECDERFMRNVMAMANDPAMVSKMANDFKIVFTPFHGCGHKLVPLALRRLGLKHILCEEQQMVIDGNFPTVKSPNPENPEGFYLAVELAKQNGATLIVGTDPDADRVGIMVRSDTGDYVPFTGNQTGALLCDYLIGAKQRADTMPECPAVLKSIVSSEMVRAIAEKNGVSCFDTFTGFKFMAEKIAQFEQAHSYHAIFSFEESYGYMIGNYVRDKDAVTASMLIVEMACWYASQNMTLFDALGALYEKYGYFAEKTHNLVMPGLDGLAKMADLMASLRANPYTEIAGTAVTQFKDYRDGSVIDLSTGERSTMELSGSNVLRFELSDGTSFIVRPSGTEPKIKVYILASGATREDAKERIARYGTFVQTMQG